MASHRRLRIGLASLTLIGVTMSAFGCKDGREPGRGATSGAVATTSESGKQPPPDQSLTPEDYIRRGVPAHDREWAAEDMVRASEALAAIARADERQLPRYGSDRSGTTFRRITSAENLNLFLNRSLPIDARFQQSDSYFQSLNQIWKLYLAAYLRQAVSATELIELTGAEFRTVVVLLDLVDEFWPTVKADDPTYEVRLGGLEKLRQGLGKLFAGSVQVLAEKDQYSRSDRLRLIGYMKETFPAMAPRLPAASRQEALVRLEKLNADPAQDDVQPDLRDLHAAIRTALSKAKDP